MRMILLGAPGSGKGTQADLLKTELGIVKLSTGDLLRKEIGLKTDLGDKAAQFMNKGELVPDDVMLRIIDHKLSEFSQQNSGFILDGFPRTIMQAEGLKTVLAQHEMSLDVALHIDVPESELVHRLCSRWTCRDCHAIYSYPDGLPEMPACSSCGGELYQRDDDRKDTIVRRMNIYMEKTMPLLNFYRQEGIYVSVNGQGEVQDIYNRIIDKLNI